MTYLGIDIGSSSVKLGLFDRDWNEIKVARVPCVSAGEFVPEDWWTAIIDGLGQLPLGDVGAVGICGRGGTNVLLDEDNTVMAPSWSDRRAHEEYALLRDEHPELSGASLTLLAKARWWEAHHGPVAKATTAKDYAVFRLTGSLSGDPASGAAAGPGLEPLVRAGFPWALAGRVTDGTAELTGLRTGIPVAVGWHDGAAAAFGAGASAAATAAITIGTNAVYRVVTEEIPGGLPRYWDLTPGLTVSGGDITASGSAMAWARRLWPDASLEESVPGSRGATFLPQFSGRIAPDVNREARGGFAGLDGSQSPADMVRAVAEGIAFSLRQVRDHLGQGGLVASRSVATGGGAHDGAMPQLVADVLQQSLLVARSEEGCRGAALLAAVAANHLELETARTRLPEYDSFAPDETTFAAYDAGYERFLRAQRAFDAI